MNRRLLVGSLLVCTCAGERPGVKAPGTRSVQLVRPETAVVERLEGVNGLDSAPVGALTRGRKRGDDDVVQLREHGRARHFLVSANAAARPGDHEVVTRRENCFEERLADLRARVVVADERDGGSQIVTVYAAAAARAGVVEPENADNAEGQPPQRRQRAHGDATPEEVGTARHTLNAIGKEPADICERNLDPRRLATDDGMFADLGDDPAELVELPLLGGAHVEELFGHIQQRVAPLSGGAVTPHVVCDRRETCDDVGQVPGDDDVVTLDAERRDVARCEADVVVTHRHSHEHPVNRDPPRVGGESWREAPRPPGAGRRGPSARWSPRSNPLSSQGHGRRSRSACGPPAAKRTPAPPRR